MTFSPRSDRCPNLMLEVLTNHVRDKCFGNKKCKSFPLLLQYLISNSQNTVGPGTITTSGQDSKRFRKQTTTALGFLSVDESQSRQRLQGRILTKSICVRRTTPLYESRQWQWRSRVRRISCDIELFAQRSQDGGFRQIPLCKIKDNWRYNILMLTARE